jgi:molybdate transport system regulatory protein
VGAFPFGPLGQRLRTHSRGDAMAKLKLRILFDAVMLGPGKAELMERIQATGSISAAGRQMEMSYKRAWVLVETLNDAFQEPLVISTRGGAGGGGAQLTPMGAEILRRYRAVEAIAQSAAADELLAMGAMLKPATKVDISGKK